MPKWEYVISISPCTNSMLSSDLRVCVFSVGSGVTQREDLAWVQRAARCEEDDFHRVSLQQPAKALWSAALRPGLRPHEQVGLLEAVLFQTLHLTHAALHIFCIAVSLAVVLQLDSDCSCMQCMGNCVNFGYLLQEIRKKISLY